MTRPMFKDFLPEGLVSSYEVDEEAFLNTGGVESPFANDLDEQDNEEYYNLEAMKEAFRNSDYEEFWNIFAHQGGRHDITGKYGMDVQYEFWAMKDKDGGGSESAAEAFNWLDHHSGLNEGHMSEIMIGVEEYLGDMISRGIVDENEQLVLLNDRYHNLVSIDVIRRIKADKGDVEPADMYDAEITPNVNESIEVNEIRMLTEKLMKR